MKHFISFIFAIVAPAILIFIACIHEQAKMEPQADPQESAIITAAPSAKRQISSVTLDWWSATPKQVITSVCQAPVLSTTAEIEKYFSQIPQKAEEDSVLEYAGIQFKNEKSSLIEAFTHLTQNAEWRHEKDAIPDLQSKYKINPTCSKVLCAMKKMFGKDVGPKMLYLMHKYNLNTSPLSWTNASVLNDDEITDVIKTLRFFPPAFFPLELNKKLIRFKRGYMRTADVDPTGQSFVVANSTIELFDPWTESAHTERQQALFHEIGHNMAESLLGNLDTSAAWLRLGNWPKENVDALSKQARDHRTENHHGVSKYGNSNAAEDFAESFNAYRFNPELLKIQSPGKYNYMKQLVYDGLEYTSAKDCGRSTELQSIQKKLAAEAPAWSANELEKISDNCAYEFYFTTLSHLPMLFFQQCVDYQATLLWQSHHPTDFDSLVPRDFLSKDFHRSELHFQALYAPIAENLQKNVVATYHKILEHNKYQLDDGDDLPTACRKLTSFTLETGVPDYKQFMYSRELPLTDAALDPSLLFSTCVDIYRRSNVVNLNSAPTPSEAQIQEELSPRFRAAATPVH